MLVQHLVLSVPLAFITIIISSICFFYWISNKRRAAKASVQENVVEDLELPLMSLETISIATDHFSASNKLGEGGFGMVYKGRLLDGQEIAVKRLSKVSGQGSDEFKNELTLITKVQHVNLVRLVGYSVNGDEKLLIYEFIENGSLDLYLFDETQSCNLNWSTRFEITKGIARGLLYLHQDSAILMIHRDLKPGNVLLDKDMTPKISDFGMARIFGRGENNVNTAKVVGTYGYMSPEYAQDGTYSVKSDVFSFGVVMLEILSGKRNKGFARENDGLSLLSHAWTKWTKGEWACVIDPIVDPSSEEVKRCFQISLLCVQDRPEDRPKYVFGGNDARKQNRDNWPTSSTRLLLPYGWIKCSIIEQLGNLYPKPRLPLELLVCGRATMNSPHFFLAFINKDHR